MNLYKQLGSIPAIRVAFATFLLTLVMLVISWKPVDVFWAAMPIPGKTETTRQVGFASAVNWSLNFLLVVPCMYFFIFSAFQSLPLAFRDLGNRRMLRKQNMESCSADGPDAAMQWAEMMSRSQWIVLLFICLAIGVSMNEWWSYSGGPLLLGKDVAEKEADWSVKFLQNTDSTDKWTNALFSFFVFLLLQAPFAALLLLFFFFIYRFCEFIAWLATPSDDCLLVPYLGDKDEKRRGFEVFETPAENILLTAAFAYGAFYLSRLWNVYLRADSTSLTNFIASDLSSGFSAGNDWLDKLKNLGASLFEVKAGDFSSTMVTFGAVATLALSLAVALIVLRFAANRARQNLLQHLEALPNDATWEGLAKSEALDRLSRKNMDVWPLRYPRPNELILLGVFAVASIVFFRLGLLYIGALILVSAKKAKDLLKKSGPEAEESKESTLPNP